MPVHLHHNSHPHHSPTSSFLVCIFILVPSLVHPSACLLLLLFVPTSPFLFPSPSLFFFSIHPLPRSSPYPSVPLPIHPLPRSSPYPMSMHILQQQRFFLKTHVLLCTTITLGWNLCNIIMMLYCSVVLLVYSIICYNDNTGCQIGIKRCKSKRRHLWTISLQLNLDKNITYIASCFTSCFTSSAASFSSTLSPLSMMTSPFSSTPSLVFFVLFHIFFFVPA